MKFCRTRGESLLRLILEQRGALPVEESNLSLKASRQSILM